MESHALRAHALDEARVLGAPPAEPHRHGDWEARRGAAVRRLATLAGGDPVLLRRAALEPASKHIEPEARQLLLDAADAPRDTP